MHKRLIPLTLLTAAFLLAACAPAAEPTTVPPPTEVEAEGEAELTPIRLSLGYIPDVQFAPFYVGIEKGFFADHGIDLTTEHRQETDGARLLATGEIKFAVASGEQILLGRAQDLPLVYVFEWYEDYPVGIAAKADSGIATVADLAGHSVGVPVKEGASYIGLEAMLFSAGLTDADINLEATGYAQVETLLTDQADAVVIYVANEPVQLAAQGADVNLMRVSDVADLVGNGLITSERVIADEPELVEAMTAALAESLQYTIDHPDEAFTISQQYVEGLDNPDVEATAREVLARSTDLWRPANRLGESEAASWQAMQDVLLAMGLLDAPLDLDAVYTNEYLP